MSMRNKTPCTRAQDKHTTWCAQTHRRIIAAKAELHGLRARAENEARGGKVQAGKKRTDSEKNDPEVVK